MIERGPVGGAGELNIELFKKELEKIEWTAEGHCAGASTGSYTAKLWPWLTKQIINAALVAKTQQGVPRHCNACGRIETGWRYDRCPNCGELAPRLPGPVSDDTIHHGMVPPAEVYVRGKTVREVCGGAVISFSTMNGPSELTMEREDYASEAAAPKPAPPTESEVEAAKASMRSRGVVCDAVSTPHPYAICSCTEGHKNARLVEPIASPSPVRDELNTEEVAGVKQGLEDVAAGRVKSLEQIKAELTATPAPGAERAATLNLEQCVKLAVRIQQIGAEHPYRLEHNGPNIGKWVCQCGEVLGDQPIDEAEGVAGRHIQNVVANLLREALAAAPPAPRDKRSELEQEYGQDHPWPQFDKWHKEFHEFAAGGPIAWPCAKPLRCFWRWLRKSGVTVNQNGIVEAR